MAIFEPARVLKLASQWPRDVEDEPNLVRTLERFSPSCWALSLLAVDAQGEE